ncbi:unnamed protein product [Chrysoparadoxa australica]
MLKTSTSLSLLSKHSWRDGDPPDLGTLQGRNTAYGILKLLGQGATAKVYLCREVRNTGKQHSRSFSLDGDDNLLAVKVMDKSILRKNRELGNHRGASVADAGLRLAQQEIAIMKTLAHDNIVQLVEVIDDAEHCFIVMEYVEGGPIMEWNPETLRYETLHGEEMPMPMVAAVFMDILCGLMSLHKNFIVHRDLKPENILRDRLTGCAKIADFGVAKLLDCPDDDGSGQMTLCQLTRSPLHAQVEDTQGSYCFWPPEACEEDSYNGFAADIWAAGVCLWLFAFRTLPFYDPLPMVLFDKICSEEPLLFPEGDGSKDHELLCDLLSKLLEKDPLKRMTLQEAKSHPWLSSMLSKHYPRKLQRQCQVKLVEVSQTEMERAITIAKPSPIKHLWRMSTEVTSGMAARIKRLSSGSLDLVLQGMSSLGSPFDLASRGSSHSHESIDTAGSPRETTKGEAPCSDRTALLALYKATGGSKWRDTWAGDPLVRQGWDVGAADLSSWHGVTLSDEGRVVKLDKQCSNLVGKVPAELGHLRQLTELNLSFCKLVALPEELEQLRQLRVLELQRNKLKRLPRGVGSLTRLMRLDLTDNRLQRLPNGIGLLSSLTELDLTSNKLVALPDELGLLQQLNMLSVSCNRLRLFPRAVALQLQGSDLQLRAVHNPWISPPADVMNLGPQAIARWWEPEPLYAEESPLPGLADVPDQVHHVVPAHEVTSKSNMENVFRPMGLEEEKDQSSDQCSAEPLSVRFTLEGEKDDEVLRHFDPLPAVRTV